MNLKFDLNNQKSENFFVSIASAQRSSDENYGTGILNERNKLVMKSFLSFTLVIDAEQCVAIK